MSLDHAPRLSPALARAQATRRAQRPYTATRAQLAAARQRGALARNPVSDGNHQGARTPRPPAVP